MMPPAIIPRASIVGIGRTDDPTVPIAVIRRRVPVVIRRGITATVGGTIAVVIGRAAEDRARPGTVPEQAAVAIAAMRAHDAGRDAVAIGRAVATRPGAVVMNTRFGGRRLVDMLVGEQLPRIC